MKRTIQLAMLGSFLACASANAAEVGLLLDKQFGKAHTVAGVMKFDAINPTGMGIRLGYSLMDLKVAELGIAATYHPKAENDLVVNNLDIGKFSTEYIALGAQLDWKFLVNLHAGLDIRREKLTSEYLGQKDSTTITRPWVKAGVGFSLPLPLLSPFLRLEAAVAAKQESAPSTNSDQDEIRKMLAPNYQIGLYGGIRF